MLWIFSLLTALTSLFQHGTAVITLAARDGFVMAADGLAIVEQPTDDPANPYIRTRVNADPKIAICGQAFLCGMASINPIIIRDRNIEYDFQNWISTVGANGKTSPRQYAAIIQAKARETFRNMDVVLKEDYFWNSKTAASSAFLVFQIAGFDGDIPQLCKVRLDIDRENRRLVYPEPQCTVPSPTISYFLSARRNMDEASKEGTPQARRFAAIKPRAIAVAGALLPDAPPALQMVTGEAAALIRVEGEFDPEEVGGITTVGVIPKGQLPRVFQFPNY